MAGRFSKSLRGLYEPLLVLLIIGSAALLIYALSHAFGGGRSEKIAFDAAFDDVSGIKERSSVLFKGMPVGTVGLMKYDPATDKVLVRIDIQKPVDIPAGITPYVESSLMGQSNIALRTNGPATGTSGQLLADAIKQHVARSPGMLYRVDGVRLSRADALMPGLDDRAHKAMTAASDAMVEMKDLATQSKNAVTTLNKEMSSIVLTPVKECMQEIRDFIKGPEGQSDKGLAAELQGVLDDLDRHSKSLDEIFNGNRERNTSGLVQLSQDVSGDWRELTAALLDGKDKTLAELQRLVTTLDKAGQAVGRSEAQFKKLGSASDKLGEASDSVKVFMDVIKEKPNAMVWGMNEKQRAMLEQQHSQRPKPSGAGKQ